MSLFALAAIEYFMILPPIFLGERNAKSLEFLNDPVVTWGQVATLLLKSISI